MLTTLIIDDEAHIRDTLTRLLSRYCPQVSVVGEASGVASGMKSVLESSPDLIFLDMKLSDGNAFDLLHAMRTSDFGVVLISTFDRESIRALKLSGIEYLQKPFSPTDLVEVVRRIGKHENSNLASQLKALEENLMNHI